MRHDGDGPGTIAIAAAVVRRSDGRTLLVRKRGTTAFMQPGGKREPDESPAAALVRELKEELGLTVAAGALVFLGRFCAPAAHEPGWRVQADLFGLELDEEVAPAAELAEAVWIDPAHPGTIDLADLTRVHALPLAMSMSMEASRRPRSR